MTPSTPYPQDGEMRRIAFLAFPGVVLLDLFGPWEVFALANRLIGSAELPYALELLSSDGQADILSGGGVFLGSHRPASEYDETIDTLVVPAADPALTDDLPRQSADLLCGLSVRARRTVSICGGAFLLAEAGLLNGKRATTHWRGTVDLARRYPQISVDPDAIFVKDGDVYTSAGVTAGIDLALALVAEDLGQALALECARELVVFMRRPGGQSQFSATLKAQHTERSPINNLISWVTENLATDLSVTAMAQRIHMSPRNFSRVFHAEVGQTPAAFVEEIRVEAVRRLLEGTDAPLATIASQCGFSSADAMRRSFYRVLKVSPGDYRRRFSNQQSSG